MIHTSEKIRQQKQHLRGPDIRVLKSTIINVFTDQRKIKEMENVMAGHCIKWRLLIKREVLKRPNGPSGVEKSTITNSLEEPAPQWMLAAGRRSW